MRLIDAVEKRKVVLSACVELSTTAVCNGENWGRRTELVSQGPD